MTQQFHIRKVPVLLCFIFIITIHSQNVMLHTYITELVENNLFVLSVINSDILYFLQNYTHKI